MTLPTVTETPLPLEPVTRDSFIEDAYDRPHSRVTTVARAAGDGDGTAMRLDDV
jgi:hypothetical protein